MILRRVDRLQKNDRVKLNALVYHVRFIGGAETAGYTGVRFEAANRVGTEHEIAAVLQNDDLIEVVI